MNDELQAALARLPAAFIFYDLETSGLSPQYDQLFQVAAIRTDRRFSSAGAPEDVLELRAKRQPWIVPSPAAMLVTRTSPDQLTCGLHHHFMMEQVEAFFTQTPAIAIGYNSAAFDEKHLRHALYRSLCRPYMTQSRRSTRADLMRMTQAIATIDPQVVKVPLAESGKPTFRLGPVCRANGIAFSEHDAHDAFNDVRATVALARRLQDVAPDLFDRTLALADKRYAEAILRPAASILRLMTVAGTTSVRAYGVLDLVEDDENARICIDLTIDPDEYLSLDLDQLRSWAKRRPAPLTVVRANAHEMVFSADEPGPARRLRRLVKSRCGDSEIPSPEAMNERVARVASDELFVERIQTLVAEQYAFEPSPYPEAQLYSGGMPDERDFEFARTLRNTFPWERGPMSSYFLDPRLREFSERISYEEDRSSLPPAVRDRLDAWTRERLLGPAETPWRTIAAARLEILKLAQTIPAAEAPRLRAISDWLDALEAGARFAPGA